MGVFIVIDGIDGSGKGEMVKLLGNHLKSRYKILTTREPSDGTYGKKIRSILANDRDPKINAEKLLDLFIKDREEHVDNAITPFLKEGVVICDRYYYSTIAFQATQGLDVDMLINKNKRFIKPHIAFILDLKPEIALERIKDREKEKFEQIDFMLKLREKYLELPNLLDDNIKIIDASKEKNEVFEDVRKEVDKVL